MFSLMLCATARHFAHALQFLLPIAGGVSCPHLLPLWTVVRAFALEQLQQRFNRFANYLSDSQRTAIQNALNAIAAGKLDACKQAAVFLARHIDALEDEIYDLHGEYLSRDSQMSIDELAKEQRLNGIQQGLVRSAHAIAAGIVRLAKLEDKVKSAAAKYEALRKAHEGMHVIEFANTEAYKESNRAGIEISNKYENEYARVVGRFLNGLAMAIAIEEVQPDPEDYEELNVIKEAFIVLHELQIQLLAAVANYADNNRPRS